jgi:hypothetical protein
MRSRPIDFTRWRTCLELFQKTPSYAGHVREKQSLACEYMSEDSIIRYITETFTGLNVAEGFGDHFFIYDPEHTLPPQRQMPFATLVRGDAHDTVSNLSRAGVYRLNIGVRRETYQSLFGPPPQMAPDGAPDTSRDYTVLDQILPHPVYAAMSWICVLNPSAETFETVKSFLSEAYDQAVSRHTRLSDRDQS